MALVISKTIYALILAIAETDKMVMIKDKNKLRSFRKQTIEMCAQQVHSKTGEIMMADIGAEHTRQPRYPGNGPHRVDTDL